MYTHQYFWQGRLPKQDMILPQWKASLYMLSCYFKDHGYLAAVDTIECYVIKWTENINCIILKEGVNVELII